MDSTSQPDTSEVKLKKTDSIKEALTAAVNCSKLAEEWRSRASAVLETEEPVRWPELRDICTALRSCNDGTGPWLHHVCQGSMPIWQLPPKRERSPELQARIAKLQSQHDERLYEQMTFDITEQERNAKAAAEGGLKSYKDQMAYGVHVLAMMGTFYAVGYYGMGQLSKKLSHRAVAGLVGMILAMLLETVLLIIRTTVPYELPIERAEKELAQKEKEAELRRKYPLDASAMLVGSDESLSSEEKKEQ